MNKLFALIFITFVVYSQQADVAGIMRGVINGCCSGNNVPASVCTPAANAMVSAAQAAGLARRRLQMTSVIVTAGCTAGYNAAVASAGVPGPVSNCFRAQVVSQCTAQVKSALGVRRLRGHHHADSRNGHRPHH